MSAPNSSPGPNKELSTETRLLLAFALMGLVLFATPYFFKTVAPPAPPKKPPAAAQQAPAPNAPPAVAEQAPAKGAQKEAAEPVQPVGATKEETYTINTDLYRIVFSNRGAVVHEWILKKYQDDDGKPLELVNTAGVAKAGYPFSLYFDQQKPGVDLDTALYAAKPADDGLGITYEYAEGAVNVRKSFRFQNGRYVAQVATEVILNGLPLPHMIVWRGGFGDPSTAASALHSIYYDVADSRLVTRDAKSAKNGPVSSEGTYAFAGIEDNYFTAAFLSNEPRPIRMVTLSDAVATTANPKEEPRAGTAIGSGARNNFLVFVGPKDIDILRKVNAQLVNVVDFGRWFGFLAKPLFLALHFVNDKWVRNYGWAIIVVTVLINILLFPLKLSNLKSMRKMQALQPHVAAINEKYKGISMRDPRAQQKNEEVMALYKKHGANPMGGCLPMVIQIPFFIAFYQVLRISIELRHAGWLWVTDLSSPEHLGIHVLPIAMIATQFFLQKMTPATSADPNQQRMMLMMPLIMGFFFYNLASGLVLYYLTVNLVGMAQQWFFNKTVSVADIPAPPVEKKPARSKR